jgi:uncharacterized protein (UPF0297 family)
MGTGFISGRGGNRDSFRNMAASDNKNYIEEMTGARNMLHRMVEAASILKEGVLQLRGVLSGDPQYVPFIERAEKE